MQGKSQQIPDTLPLWRETYPELDDAQLLEAREHLRTYLAVVWRIHERLEAKNLSNDSDHLDGSVRSI